MYLTYTLQWFNVPIIVNSYHEINIYFVHFKQNEYNLKKNGFLEWWMISIILQIR